MMLSEFGQLLITIIGFIASYDLTAYALGFCMIAFAFALFYNLSGSEKL